ncbi:MAG: hypothetical protein U5L76_03180 [Patescibacteria group bacterium]|nr:hypothetical protein [Patescibacteria group bacterium]
MAAAKSSGPMVIILKKEDVAVEKSMSPSEEIISAGQAAKIADLVIARLRKSELPHAVIQSVIEKEGAEIAANFVADVRNRVEACLLVAEPHILKRLPFDVENFIGKGWSVNEQVSKRSSDNLEAGQITRNDYLKEGESYINGEERLRRIKVAGEQDLQLDAEDFLALWQEEGHTTLNWLYETKGITWLSFWGTILGGPVGRRLVLYLCRYVDGSWRWLYDWVDRDVWSSGRPAAVLASN